MYKKELYTKTQRLGTETFEWLLTEKLDGSNLCFFKHSGFVYVALRKNIIELYDILQPDASVDTKDIHNKLYKGLEEWLNAHGMDLYDQLAEGAAICGEWLGMGQLKYPDSMPRYNMFAKARVDEDADFSDLQLTRIDYDPENFHYVFRDDVIPDYIGVVPVIARVHEAPTTAQLDEVYAHYAASVQRPVEGIVITQKELPDRRCKYVRMKAGKLGPHLTTEDIAALREERMKQQAKASA